MKVESLSPRCVLTTEISGAALLRRPATEGGELDCRVRAHFRTERHMDGKDSHNYDDSSELRKIAIALGARRAIAVTKSLKPTDLPAQLSQ